MVVRHDENVAFVDWSDVQKGGAEVVAQDHARRWPASISQKAQPSISGIMAGTGGPQMAAYFFTADPSRAVRIADATTKQAVQEITMAAPEATSKK